MDGGVVCFLGHPQDPSGEAPADSLPSGPPESHCGILAERRPRSLLEEGNCGS